MARTKTSKIDWKKIIENTKKVNYNLYDLVPMDVSNIEKLDGVIEAEIVDDEVDELTDLKQKIFSLKETSIELKEKHKINDNKLKPYIEEAVENYNKKREEYFVKNLDLPSDALLNIDKHNVEEYEDLITLAVVAPRTKIKDIKAVADALGFMILPWEYHNKSSFSNEDEKTKKAIKKFEKLEKYCDIYVVSPINFWDIKAHISSDDPNKIIWTSSKIKNIVSSVEIQMPLLREIYFKLENHEDRIKTLEINVKKTVNSINDLQNKFEEVVQEIAEMREEIIKKDNQIKRLKDEIIEAKLETERVREK